MDMREKMIDTAYDGIDNVHDLDVTLDDYAEAAADAIIVALPDMVQDLEWVPAKWCCQTFYTANYLYRVNKVDSEALWRVTYATVPLRHTNGLARWFDTIEDAQAAANAHHRAQVMKAFGMEVK